MRATVAVIAAAVVCAAGAAVAAIASSSASSGSSKPNYVFVLTDDLSMNLLAHMPAVQQMQKDGTTLSNYYVVDSLCCPSRSAIFTGEYPHDDGVFTNTGPDGGYDAYNAHGNQQRAFAVALQKAGYDTGFMGKYLNGYDPNDPVPPGWGTWDVAGDGYKEFNYKLNQNGKEQFYGHAASDYMVDVLSGKGAAFIRSAGLSRKPFMLEVATFAPHSPYVPAPRYADSFPTLAYPTTPAYDTIPTDPPPFLANQAPLNKGEERTILADYRLRVRAVQAVDDLIENLEQSLRVAGVAQNTYLVFSSDNGYHMGENRLYPGKQTAFDTDIHLPLVVVGPHVPKGRTDARMASNIDLAPTFEDLAGLTTPTTADGVSLAPLWHGTATPSWQQAVLIEHHGAATMAANDPDRQDAKHGNPPSYEAVRTASALYVRYTADGAQEYYATGNDPYERHNLAASGVPAALPKALAALQNCHGRAQCQAAARLA